MESALIEPELAYLLFELEKLGLEHCPSEEEKEMFMSTFNVLKIANTESGKNIGNGKAGGSGHFARLLASRKGAI